MKDSGEAVQGGIQNPLQLWQGLHCRDQENNRTRLKEHWEGFQRGMMEKSAVAEHAWKEHHFIRWKEETTVMDTTRHPGKPPLKEALHIHMTPAEEHLNRNTGLEIHEC